MNRMDSLIPEDHVISRDLGRPGNNKKYFHRIPKNFVINLLVSPSMVNPVNEMHISIDRVRAISEIVFQI